MFKESDSEILQEKLHKAFDERPDLFQPLLPPSAAASSPFSSEVAHIKRLLEHWCADASFRDEMMEDATAAAARHGHEVDPEEVRYLWDAAFAHKCLSERTSVPYPVQRYRVWNSEKILHREAVRLEHCLPQDPRQRAWRERQMKRIRSQLGENSYVNIVHAPFSIEISEGCSVGCWFCGVSAKKKGADFRYTPENRKLWLEVLQALRRIIGEGAKGGFCYWATDPIDNPDYEELLTDFARICGRFPQTTTAQPLKDVERTRALLKLSSGLGCDINRFSITTLKTFKEVHKTFTAEELLHTELVLQNREAVNIQSNSGRARGSKILSRRAESAANVKEGWDEVPGTVSCVSGFLINMVNRSIRLVTPCPSDEIWPEGHWILDEANFTDGDDFAQRIEGMIDQHMRPSLRASDPGRFRRDLQIEILPDGFKAQGFGELVTYEGGTPSSREVATELLKGHHTVGEVALALEDRLNVPASTVFSFLNDLFDRSLLDEEPSGNPTMKTTGGQLTVEHSAKVS
ncbi:radical SAM family RiPP maturation amino acid epimerase [Myxococcota bacterium]|nr:radical SAM family RiPP maturation amino acid epimerase [Myxococcota bacterium]